MKFCKISRIVWIDNFICWIPVFVVPVSIVKPWNLVNHEKAYATTWTREVWSKGAVTWYNFLFGFSFQHAFCQTFQHRLVSYIHLTVWKELYCENSERKVIWESNLKVGMCEHLTIQLTCATDAESLRNQTVNQNVWPHSSYHDSEFKSQWKSIKVYENEWNHNTKYSYKMQCH